MTILYIYIYTHLYICFILYTVQIHFCFYLHSHSDRCFISLILPCMLGKLVLKQPKYSWKKGAVFVLSKCAYRFFVSNLSLSLVFGSMRHAWSPLVQFLNIFIHKYGYRHYYTFKEVSYYYSTLYYYVYYLRYSSLQTSWCTKCLQEVTVRYRRKSFTKLL